MKLALAFGLSINLSCTSLEMMTEWDLVWTTLYVEPAFGFMHLNSSGSPYQLGPADGLGCHGWKTSPFIRLLNLIFNHRTFSC